MNDAVPLPRLTAGARAKLHRTNLAARERQVLEAMGLLEGCTLRVLQRAGACIVQLGSMRVALAGPVARRILVKPL